VRQGLLGKLARIAKARSEAVHPRAGRDKRRHRLAEAKVLWANAQRCFEAAFGKMESDTLRSELKVLVSTGFLEAFQSALHAEQGRA
jgi:hypothetical protein